MSRAPCQLSWLSWPTQSVCQDRVALLATRRKRLVVRQEPAAAGRLGQSAGRGECQANWLLRGKLTGLAMASGSGAAAAPASAPRHGRVRLTVSSAFARRGSADALGVGGGSSARPSSPPRSRARGPRHGLWSAVAARPASAAAAYLGETTAPGGWEGRAATAGWSLPASQSMSTLRPASSKSAGVPQVTCLRSAWIVPTTIHRRSSFEPW